MFLQLIEFLSDKNEAASADVLVFIREAIQRFEQLRQLIIQRMLDAFPTIKAVKSVAQARQPHYILQQSCYLFAGLFWPNVVLIEYRFAVNRIWRAALWILGEYCTTSDDIQAVMTLVRQSLGDVSASSCYWRIVFDVLPWCRFQSKLCAKCASYYHYPPRSEGI